MGGVIVGDKACLAVVSTSSLLFCSKSQFSWLATFLGQGGRNSPAELLLERISGQMRGVRRGAALWVSCLFPVPTAQNNLYTKVTYFRVKFALSFSSWLISSFLSLNIPMIYFTIPLLDVVSISVLEIPREYFVNMHSGAHVHKFLRGQC